jgi:hypothetical protein
MWLAIVAILISTVSLFSSITQELAWNRRIEEFAALVASAPPSVQPPVVALQPTEVPTLQAVVVSDPETTPVPQSTPIPQSTPALSSMTYEQVCDVDESNMTDPQLQAHAAQFANQPFTGWRGWVYDVVIRSDGSYNLEIAMEERGLFWSRDIVAENIPTDLALRLNVEQPIVFDGRIVQVEYTFEVMCNPLITNNVVVR